MLLDQKRTRRTIQIVSILTSVAFLGVIFIVLGLIFFGGSGGTAADQALDDAKARIEREPRSDDAWAELASAYRGNEQIPEAIGAARKALSFAPRSFRRTQDLISLQLEQGDTAGAIDVLNDFTAKNPKSAEAFLQLGQLAEEAGRKPLAQLSYQTYLRLAPDDSNAAEVQNRLDKLTGAAPQTTTGG